MRCGNCKGSHDTVALVRGCFANVEGQPSDKQMSLAQALGRERARLAEHTAMSEEDYHTFIGGMSRKEIGDFITKMLKQSSSILNRHELFARVANGRYALRNEDDDDIRFYLIGGGISRMLWELTGAPGDFRQTRIYRPEKILKRIGDDPVAAFALYGINVGQCGKCGSPLTQKHTRERGVGDICYAKLMREK